MDEAPHALTSETDGVITVTLNRPEKLNPISPQVTEILWEAVRALGSRDDLRVMVITGTGRYFSSGLDLKLRHGDRLPGPEAPGVRVAPRVPLAPPPLRRDGEHREADHRGGQRAVPGRRHRDGGVVRLPVLHPGDALGPPGDPQRGRHPGQRWRQPAHAAWSARTGRSGWRWRRGTSRPTMRA